MSDVPWAVDVVRTEAVPPGTMLIGAIGAPARTYLDGVEQAPLRFGPDLWGPRPPGFTDHAAFHRRSALDNLAFALDRLCRRHGLDPQAAWRDAAEDRARARDRTADRWRFVAHERVALSIMPPDRSIAVITGI